MKTIIYKCLLCGGRYANWSDRYHSSGVCNDCHSPYGNMGELEQKIIKAIWEAYPYLLKHRG